jgi:hypothetical protein
MKEPFSVHFFIRREEDAFAWRPMHGFPQVGDKCVFKDVRYTVAIVEWCMDTDASVFGKQRINIELEKV